MEAIVRIVNNRTNRIILNVSHQSDIEAYRSARELAEEFADRFGDEEWHAEREMPFVADPLCAYDSYSVFVYVRDETRYLCWKGQHEVKGGFVEAFGYLASC